MSFGISQRDPSGALREFCAMLRDLRRAAGGPTVESLAKNPTIPLARAHIYATLGGKIAKPPTWKFVEAFVRRCAEYATDHNVNLETTVDPNDWNREYKALLRLWERRNQAHGPTDSVTTHRASAPGRMLTMQDVTYFPVHAQDGGAARRLGIVTGDIRQVRCANVWVNSENTEMEMARVHEFSISAIIRYEGARHDARGRVADDLIADDLERKVADQRPLEPGSVVVTSAGELARRNGVRHVVHVAAVHGEPGAGFRPIAEIGRCVTNVLLASEDLEMPGGAPVTVLFPLLGAGNAGGDRSPTATTLIHAARNYLRAVATTRIEAVYFLAYTDLELKACLGALRSAGLRAET